jgi:hypothetical protein
VWGFYYSEKIERVHLQFCKHLLGVRPQTQNNLGRTILFYKQLVSVVRYLFKMNESDENTYIKKVYG